ncbi:hypothetical protein SAMN05444162_1019 [Paenibacillaceae bacterium GAS479]|nr:hypothetical protein SAMN05444162_1019 [Paenibacillaceae bacterium GAS479]
MPHYSEVEMNRKQLYDNIGDFQLMLTSNCPVLSFQS